MHYIYTVHLPLVTTTFGLSVCEKSLRVDFSHHLWLLIVVNNKGFPFSNKPIAEVIKAFEMIYYY